MTGNPFGKDVFRANTPDWQARRDRDAAQAAKLAPRASKGPVGSSPNPVNYGGTNVAVGSGGRGGLLAGLVKLFVIGIIILALGGYFGSHQSDPARRPSPSETAPKASYRTQPSYTSPPSYATPQGESPGNAGANATDPQKGSDINLAAQAPPPVPAQTNQTPAPSTSTIPQNDPVGPGGFITPHETELVQREVLVCVPLNLLDHQWNNPPPGGKMEAFMNATEKMIRDEARSMRVGDNTQFMVLDKFASFDPARADALSLVTFWNVVSGKPNCAADCHPYTLTVETNP